MSASAHGGPRPPTFTDAEIAHFRRWRLVGLIGERFYWGFLGAAVLTIIVAALVKLAHLLSSFSWRSLLALPALAAVYGLGWAIEWAIERDLERS